MYGILTISVSILYTVMNPLAIVIYFGQSGSRKRDSYKRWLKFGRKIFLSLTACFKKGNNDFISHRICFICAIEYDIIYFTVARPSSLIDSQTQEVLLADCISRDLKRALDQYNLDMSENFNAIGRYVVLSQFFCIPFHHRVLIIASTVSEDYGVTL